MKIKLPVAGCRLPVETKNGARTFFQIVNRKSKIVNAFTLIEIVLSVAIFCMVMAMIYSTWLMIMRSTVVGLKAAAETQRERVAIHTIEEAITSVESFQASLQYYSFNVQNSEDDQQATLSFVARLPDDFPRSGRYGIFNVRRLTFSVEPVTDPVTHTTENDLVLRQYPIITGDVDADEQQNPFVLSRNVKIFEVQCWDTNTPGWVDEWDDTNSIPPAIRVNLALGGNNDNSQSSTPVFAVTRDIAVPTQMMPVSAQVPGANPAMFQNGGEDMSGGGTAIGNGGGGGGGGGGGRGGRQNNGNGGGRGGGNKFGGGQ